MTKIPPVYPIFRSKDRSLNSTLTYFYPEAGVRHLRLPTQPSRIPNCEIGYELDKNTPRLPHFQKQRPLTKLYIDLFLPGGGDAASPLTHTTEQNTKLRNQDMDLTKIPPVYPIFRNKDHSLNSTLIIQIKPGCTKHTPADFTYCAFCAQSYKTARFARKGLSDW